jgi:uncharacterized protein YciI
MKLLLILIASTALLAQTATLKSLHEFNRTNILKAAEKLTDTEFDYRPTPEVRSVRELLGHVADGNWLICSMPAGKKETKAFEKAALPKAELTKVLNESFDYCASIWDGKGAAYERAQAMIAYHAGQHYGNLSTYLRLKGKVPPSSESAAQQKAKPEMIKYYLGLLVKGPKHGIQSEDAAEIQKNHLSHLRSMWEQGKLVVAGPLGDNQNIRGILVFRGGDSMEEMKALAEQDPAVKAGRLAVEIHPWFVEKGVLP